ncbi:MAG: glycosyltransferase family 4 protein [Lachnospiraceae bacterium]|nr:glycosyltransferase family 4 protein [Lachnospiraceae bacterium]
MGGVEQYTYNLAKALAKMGNQVTVVTSNVMNSEEYENTDGISVYRLPCFNLMEGRFPVLKVNKNMIKIHRLLMRFKFDFVMVNTRFYIHSLYGVIFAKMQKVKCIIVDHGTSHLNLHNPILNFVENIYEHSITKMEQLFCNEFYGVSMASVEWLRHFHIYAKGALYNAVDMDKINQIKKGKLRDFRKEFNVPDDAVMICFTGRLIKEKGIYQLIKSVDRLNSNNKKYYLFIAGDGEEYQQILSQKSEEVVLLGRISTEEVIGLLVQSDIFCLPSDSEGFSSSVLEATACKCCVITTERGGSKELIVDKNHGIIIPNNKVEHVMTALEMASENQDYRNSVAEAAYDRLIHNYTWDIVAQRVYELI